MLGTKPQSAHAPRGVRRAGQRLTCCSCSGTSFGEVIDLGLMPLVNNLLDSPDEDCPRWPLKVVFCRGCSLAQLTETPPPEAMFKKYLYFSSQSQTMIAHAGELVRRFVGPRQRVVEIASNDGYLLNQAKATGAKVLGIDPAENIAAFANKQGVPTRCEYFNAETARGIAETWGRADVMFANNVLAHVPDPNEIARGIAILLERDGTAHIEVPSLMRMIEIGAFDTIYHEHRCYFSLTALKALFNRHGLRVVSACQIEVHGGSLHLELRHDGDEAVADQMIEAERSAGILTEDLYDGFARRVDELRNEVDRALNSFTTVCAYGAAAKGAVLLNTFGLDSARISWVADVSPHKQGKFVPGTLQPIVSPEELTRAKPQAALLLPWNIQDEILRRNDAYRHAGGKFITALPRVEIL